MSKKVAIHCEPGKFVININPHILNRIVNKWGEVYACRAKGEGVEITPVIPFPVVNKKIREFSEVDIIITNDRMLAKKARQENKDIVVMKPKRLTLKSKGWEKFWV